MILGLQTAETAMRPKLMRMELIANNLANVNTTGFKRDRLFVQMLKDSSQPTTNAAGDLTGVSVVQGIDFSDGSLRQTGNPLDVAIQGRGFFAVNTPGGVRYTRSGSFRLSADGSLVNADGYPVAGAEGEIRFPDIQKLQQASVSIAESGEVMVDRETIGRIRVVDFPDTSLLAKETASLFSAAPGAPTVEGPVSPSAVKQGFLEESNVNGVEEMIAMTELQRSFDTDQKVLQAMDDSVAKSLEVGKV
ncbi:MAG TPA: flagellar basal-body rod protein FlgF [Bacteroidota bacterium]|nr:flagellar basal-body rod protein FlgF [Bacteroidota bacterium]